MSEGGLYNTGTIVVVTEAMIKAGVEAHEACEGWSIEDLVTEIYLAMERAKGTPPLAPRK